MKLSKLLLCIATLSVISCSKQTVDKNYPLDIELSFETSEDISQMTVRQYEITLNGQTITTAYITGSTFSKTETLQNVAAPATVDVKVTTIFIGSELPESMKVKNTYKITCKDSKGFATSENTSPSGTLPREELSDYFETMNYTKHFKVNEGGKISKE